MNLWVRRFTAIAILAAFATPALADSMIDKYKKLYGLGSSSKKYNACMVDDKHTMKNYIKDSLTERLHEDPKLFNDRSVIDIYKIPNDIEFSLSNNYYINNKPTAEYFLPSAQPEFSLITITCPYGECGWVIYSQCTVIAPNGQPMIAYWNQAGELSYVLKRDFDQISSTPSKSSK